MLKTCIVCGKKYENRDKRSKYCSKECLYVLEREKYKIKKEKACKDCGSLFYGRGKQLYCDCCKDIRLKNKNFETQTKKSFCKKCGKFLFEEKKKVTKKIKDDNISFLCGACKLENRKNLSEKMKGEGNPNWNPFVERTVLTEEEKVIKRKETKERISKRMRLNNPMFNPETVNKMAETMKQKYENGDIKRKLGKDNPLWKGNRNHDLTIRARLKKWVRLILERDNFTCQECKIRGDRLEVHHNKPLRKINQEFAEKYGFSSINEIDINSDIFKKISEEITDYHHTNAHIGITYCRKCHGKIDKQRHLKRNDNNEDKEDFC